MIFIREASTLSGFIRNSSTVLLLGKKRKQKNRKEKRRKLENPRYGIITYKRENTFFLFLFSFFRKVLSTKVSSPSIVSVMLQDKVILTVIRTRLARRNVQMGVYINAYWSVRSVE